MTFGAFSHWRLICSFVRLAPHLFAGASFVCWRLISGASFVHLFGWRLICSLAPHLFAGASFLVPHLFPASFDPWSLVPVLVQVPDELEKASSV